MHEFINVKCSLQITAIVEALWRPCDVHD